MIKFTRINHIHICVPAHRLEQARLFYIRVIGLRQIKRPDVFPEPGHWFAVGDIELHIGVEDARPVTIRHSAFEVDNLEAARIQLEAHGIRINEEPVISGRTRFSFLDPFGNRMELMEIIDR